MLAVYDDFCIIDEAEKRGRLRAERYTFRTNDVVMDMINLMAGEDDLPVNHFLERLVMAEYKRRDYLKSSQISWGDWFEDL